MVYTPPTKYFTSFMYILLRNIDLEFNFQSYINMRTLLLFFCNWHVCQLYVYCHVLPILNKVY